MCIFDIWGLPKFEQKLYQDMLFLSFEVCGRIWHALLFNKCMVYKA